jgi:hypothetical protein
MNTTSKAVVSCLFTAKNSWIKIFFMKWSLY